MATKIDAPYPLSDGQKQFVRKALREGFEIKWDYSGRAMYGRKCPAVYCSWGAFGFKGARTDSMGRGMVIYMP